jgi:hypothetical protein
LIPGVLGNASALQLLGELLPVYRENGVALAQEIVFPVQGERSHFLRHRAIVGNCGLSHCIDHGRNSMAVSDSDQTEPTVRVTSRGPG